MLSSWRSFFITKLSEPHTKAPEHSSTRRKLSNETFGRKLAKIFENFEEKPVASGSIVQVHGASQQLKPIVVAIKVRHPGVRESIWRDFVIINMVAKISNFILLSVCSNYWRKLGVIELMSMAMSVLSW
ncbi:unnamed protein product [Prunus armeniaca]